MKTFKRLICILLTVILLIPFAGCRKDNGIEDENNDGIFVDPPIPLMQYIWAATENPYNIKDKENIEIEFSCAVIDKYLLNLADRAVIIIEKNFYLEKENLFDELEEMKGTIIADVPYKEFLDKYYCGEKGYENEDYYEATDVYNVPVSVFTENKEIVFIGVYIIKNDGEIVDYLSGQIMKYEKNGDNLTLNHEWREFNIES